MRRNVLNFNGFIDFENLSSEDMDRIDDLATNFLKNCDNYSFLLNKVINSDIIKEELFEISEIVYFYIKVLDPKLIGYNILLEESNWNYIKPRSLIELGFYSKDLILAEAKLVKRLLCIDKDYKRTI